MEDRLVDPRQMDAIDAAGAAHTESPTTAEASGEEQFRAAMRRLAGAVAVVTVGAGADRTGFTATSVTSLSVSPPSILVSLDRSSSSWPMIQRYGAFCVNVLSAEQAEIGDRFAGRGGAAGADRYQGAQWRELPTGTSALAGALITLDCELEEAIERHSHAILIGRVRSSVTGADARPLLYWHRGYRTLA